MNRQRLWNAARLMMFILMCGGIGTGMALAGGMPGGAPASESGSQLSVKAGRLTGRLTQVTLRTVLEQLEKQLNIRYVVPDEALDTRVSLMVNNEPIAEALAKMLAPWDYAFSLDAGGNITTLYIMAKELPETTLADARSSGGKSENTGRNGRELLSHGRSGLKRSMRTSNQLEKADSLFQQSGQEKEEMIAANPWASLAVQMEIMPPAPGATMPVFPPEEKDMRLIPVDRSQSMEIVPPAAYSPMSIQPVPEHVKQEMRLPVGP